MNTPFSHSTMLKPQNLPAAVDWRCKTKRALAPVIDQKCCNCCWAIVAAATVESLLAIKGKTELVQLSYQDLIDNVQPKEEKPKKELKPNECITTTINQAFRYIVSNGIRFAEEYPFVWERRPPRPKDEHVKFAKISGFERVEEDEISVMIAVAEQPLGAKIYIFDALKKMQKGQIYEGPDEEEIEKLRGEKPQAHAVLIIGYDTDKLSKKNFWWIQNSWGTGWADEGYCRVSRDSRLSMPGEEKEPLLTKISRPIL